MVKPATMKKILIFSIFFVLLFPAKSQIKQIASYNANWNTASLFAISDTCVYRYSYYYEEWFPLPNTDLPRRLGIVNIKAIAVADTGTSYTSGLYIIADTAVFTYSWYYDKWYSLYTTGLNRINNRVQLSEISVDNKGSQSDHNIFVISDGDVFTYSWYEDKWLALSSEGLGMKKINPTKSKLINYPNPFKENTTISYDFENAFSGKIEVVIYNSNGKIIDIVKVKVVNTKEFRYKYTKKLPKGLYIYELKAGKNKSLSKMLIL